MRKFNTFLLSILILLVATCMVVGSLYHFTDVFKEFKPSADVPPSLEVPDVPNIPNVPDIDKEPEITEPSFFYQFPEYGTYVFNKVYFIPETDSKPITTSLMIKDKTNISLFKKDIYDFYNDRYNGSLDLFKDGFDSNEFELVVIPNYDLQTGTQSLTSDDVDFSFKEKITGDTFYRTYYQSTESSDIIMYTLENDTLIYNKPYADIPVENKKFTIGLYSKTYNVCFINADYNMVGKVDNEYCYFVSDKNYIFCSSLGSVFFE